MRGIIDYISSSHCYRFIAIGRALHGTQKDRATLLPHLTPNWVMTWIAVSMENYYDIAWKGSFRLRAYGSLQLWDSAVPIRMRRTSRGVVAARLGNH